MTDLATHSENPVVGGNTKEGGRIRQRLVVCLDGTWNTRDSGTNVYQLSNLVRDDENGVGPDGWRQRVHYDAGVGTGLLDGVSGGAFGIGLSKNVREAYDSCSWPSWSAGAIDAGVRALAASGVLHVEGPLSRGRLRSPQGAPSTRLRCKSRRRAQRRGGRSGPG